MNTQGLPSVHAEGDISYLQIYNRVTFTLLATSVMPVGSDRQRITCLPERAASVCALGTRVHDGCVGAARTGSSDVRSRITFSPNLPLISWPSSTFARA